MPGKSIAFWFAVAAVLIGFGAMIELIALLSWDPGGWTNADGEIVEASAFPWTGFVVGAVPVTIGLVPLAVAVIAQGIALGRNAAASPTG